MTPLTPQQKEFVLRSIEILSKIQASNEKLLKKIK